MIWGLGESHNSISEIGLGFYIEYTIFLYKIIPHSSVPPSCVPYVLNNLSRHIFISNRVLYWWTLSEKLNHCILFANQTKAEVNFISI